MHEVMVSEVKKFHRCNSALRPRRQRNLSARTALMKKVDRQLHGTRCPIYTVRNTCLCQRHKEMALKLKSIKNVLDTTNPDIFINRSDDEIRTTLNAIDKSGIVYKSWK